MTTDIDSAWNPKECSLDEHRQKALKGMKQAGFGAKSESFLKELEAKKTPVEAAKEEPEDLQPVAPEDIPGDIDEERGSGE